jgi:hypothetical protein
MPIPATASSVTCTSSLNGAGTTVQWSCVIAQHKPVPMTLPASSVPIELPVGVVSIGTNAVDAGVMQLPDVTSTHALMTITILQSGSGAKAFTLKGFGTNRINDLGNTLVVGAASVSTVCTVVDVAQWQCKREKIDGTLCTTTGADGAVC